MREIKSTEWLSVHSELKQKGFVRFEYLTAAHNDGTEFEIYSKVSTENLTESVLLKTTIHGEIESLHKIFSASTFHEREVSQMFGITFNRYENIENAFDLEFNGFPLRRDFALTNRQKTVWPGAVEPDEKARRRPSLPPGVHESWGSS